MKQPPRIALTLCAVIATTGLYGCGGSDDGSSTPPPVAASPNATPPATPSASPSATPSALPSASPSPSPGATPAPSPTASPPATAAPTLERSVYISGLQNPWDMAFTTDGVMFYTERGKGLSVRRSDGSTALLFKPTDMVAEGQSGMQGVAIDPQFASNRTLYVYMSSNAAGTKDNRVVRLTVDAGYTAVANRNDIVTGISYKNTPSAGAPAGSGAHSGGRIRFGPDNLLYITTGDNHNAVVPQSKTELGGKVLRVTTQGTAASANNPPSGFDKRVFAYGFRNPQGIAFRPSNGQVFTAEHGPGHSDEVTLVANGGNAGWDPGCLDNVQAYCGYGSNQSNGSVTPMTDTNKFPGAMRPTWNNGGVSAGIAGNVFLSGSQWKLWDGAMAVAFMNGNRIEILRLNTDGSLLSNTPLAQGARIRAVVQGPDGNLYASTDGKSGGDEIWKLTPQ